MDNSTYHRCAFCDKVLKLNDDVTLEAAEHELQKAIDRANKRTRTDTKFWIMKQTHKYERIIKRGDNGIITT